MKRFQLYGKILYVKVFNERGRNKMARLLVTTAVCALGAGIFMVVGRFENDTTQLASRRKIHAPPGKKEEPDRREPPNVSDSAGTKGGRMVSGVSTNGLGDAASGTAEARLEQRDFKYPIIRVVKEEIFDPHTGVKRRVVREMVGDHIMVKLKKNVSRADFEKALSESGGAVRRKVGNRDLYLVEFSDPKPDTVPKMVDLFSRFTNVVEYAEPDYIMTLNETTPNDASYSSQWGMPKIDAPRAWDYTTGSTGIVVGLIDTGVYYTHQDLAANRWENPGETGMDSNGWDKATNNVDDDANGYVDDVYGWDTINGDNDPLDGKSHGSHCAGVIGAAGNNSIGVAGVCWTVKIMALKAFTDAGDSTESAIAEAINYATMMYTNGINVRLTSNSYGGDTIGSTFRNAVNDAQKAGALFVCSAGNDNDDVDSGSSYYPAALTNGNVLTVAATTSSDGRWVKNSSEGSNYGSTSVDLGAPGAVIYSTVLNNNYDYKTGTSMAAPHVAGAAALLWSVAPGKNYAQVKKAILEGVDQVSSMQEKTVTGGRLNVYRSLIRLKPSLRGALIWITCAAQNVVFPLSVLPIC